MTEFSDIIIIFKIYSQINYHANCRLLEKYPITNETYLRLVVLYPPVSISSTQYFKKKNKNKKRERKKVKA